MELYVKNTGKINETNTICDVRMAGIKLPLDVQFSINGNKMIAESQILDGVAVFERITRKPYEIEFEFTMRSKTTISPSSTILGVKIPNAKYDAWSFPLNETTDVFQNVWVPDQVVKVENVFLNKLGIQQVVILDIQITTIRGSVDVPVKIKTKEDYYSTNAQGTTLII